MIIQNFKLIEVDKKMYNIIESCGHQSCFSIASHSNHIRRSQFTSSKFIFDQTYFANLLRIIGR